MTSALYTITLLVAGTCFGAAVVDTLVIARDNQGKPIPRHVNGFTIFYDRDQETVAAYDRTGVLRTQAFLSLPDASRMTIADVTASKAGMLAVAGSAVGNSQQVASVIT